MPGIGHPGLFALLEWVTGRHEVSDQEEVRAHLAAGCAGCEADVETLRILGALIREEAAYDAFFEDLGAADPGPSRREAGSTPACRLSFGEGADGIARKGELWPHP